MSYVCRAGRCFSFSRLRLLLAVVLPVIVFSLISIAGAACKSPSTGQTTGTTQATSPTQQYSVVVTVNDKQVALLTVSDLAKLPQVQANVAGTEEQGPTLLSALSSIGIKDFNEVTAYGYTKGRVATAELTLQRAEVTGNVMLALVARGSVKLTGTDIGPQKAIIDLNKLAIK